MMQRNIALVNYLFLTEKEKTEREKQMKREIIYTKQGKPKINKENLGRFVNKN